VVSGDHHHAHVVLDLAAAIDLGVELAKPLMRHGEILLRWTVGRRAWREPSRGSSAGPGRNRDEGRMTMGSTEAMLADITRDELIAVASDLIRFPSFKNEETALARHLAEMLGARGYAVELDEVEPGRLQTIATLKGSGGGCSLMLNGHLDVNSLSRGWT